MPLAERQAPWRAGALRTLPRLHLWGPSPAALLLGSDPRPRAALPICPCSRQGRLAAPGLGHRLLHLGAPRGLADPHSSASPKTQTPRGSEQSRLSPSTARQDPPPRRVQSRRRGRDPHGQDSRQSRQPGGLRGSGSRCSETRCAEGSDTSA